MRSGNYVLADHATARVLHEVPKNFWKIKRNIDVVIVDHTATSFLELIFYDPALAYEAPRLYVEKTKLAAKLDAENLQSVVSKKVEALTRQKKACDKKEVQRQTTEELGVQYLLSKVVVATHDAAASAEEKNTVSKQQPVGVEITLQLDIIVHECPAKVEPLGFSKIKKTR
jgi:hypothetical protein